MRQRFYILQGHMAVPCEISQWAHWIEHAADSIVAQQEVDGMCVSTVFLGIDHNRNSDGSPLLFETVVFDDDGEPVDRQRFPTWEEAEYNHLLTVNALGLRNVFHGEVNSAH